MIITIVKLIGSEKTVIKKFNLYNFTGIFFLKVLFKIRWNLMAIIVPTDYCNIEVHITEKILCLAV